MTFAALFVSEKREKGKVALCFFAGEQCSPLPYRVEVLSTAKIKDISSFAFSFAYAGAKEKAIKKKSAGREISHSAERDHRCRWTTPPFEKGGRKL